MRLFSAVLAAIGVLVLPAMAEKASIRGDGLSEELKSIVAAALPDEADAETPFEARRQAKRAAAAALNALNAEGYFAAEADIGVDPGPPPRALIRLTPGERFSIGEVGIEYDGAPPNANAESAALNAIALTPGEPADPARVIGGEARILSALKSKGYPDADIIARDVAGDRDERLIFVTYVVRSGSRARFGDLVTPEGLTTRNAYIARLSPIEPGKVYKPDDMAAFNARLARSRLFTRSAVRLADPDGAHDGGGDVERDVEVLLTERPRHTIAVGGAFSTAEGFGAEIEWTRRNFTRRGDTFSVLAEATELERGLSFGWRLPNQPRLRQALVFEAAFSNEDTDAFERNAATVGGALETPVLDNATSTFGLEYEFSDETSVIDPETGAATNETFNIISGRAALRVDRSDDALDPTTGWRFQTLVEPSTAFGADTSQFIRLTAQASGYAPFGARRRWVAAGRLRAGSIVGAETLDLPVDDRFFAGGGGSVRGFGFQDVGPLDANGDPLGGRGLFEASTELRWKAFGPLGFVAFADAGSVVDGIRPSLSELLYGAGFGVRYDTPAGPIRFDVAFPINRTGFENAFQIYISIGQAF